MNIKYFFKILKLNIHVCVKAFSNPLDLTNTNQFIGNLVLERSNSENENAETNMEESLHDQRLKLEEDKKGVLNDQTLEQSVSVQVYNSIDEAVELGYFTWVLQSFKAISLISKCQKSWWSKS